MGSGFLIPPALLDDVAQMLLGEITRKVADDLTANRRALLDAHRRWETLAKTTTQQQRTRRWNQLLNR